MIDKDKSLMKVDQVECSIPIVRNCGYERNKYYMELNIQNLYTILCKVVIILRNDSIVK